MEHNYPSRARWKPAALGILALFGLSATASAEALRIAYIEPVSGNFQVMGNAFAEGLRYGVEKINENGGFNGHPVVLTEYDNASQGNLVVERVKQALNNGERIIVSGSVSAFGAMMTDEVKKHNQRNPGKEVIYYNVGSGSLDLVAEKCHRYAFKFAANGWVFYSVAAQGMHELGALGDRVYLINPNYSFGQDAEKGQREAVEKLGGSIVGSDFVELGKTGDFSPYVAKIKAADATSILTSMFEKDLALFVKAKTELGLDIPLASQSLDSPGLIDSIGSGAVGSFLPKNWVRGAGGENAKEFETDFAAKIGHPPAYENATAAFPMMFLGEALKSLDANGGPIDIDAVAKAIENATWQSPIGEWKMRAEDHQNIQPFVLAMVTDEPEYATEGTRLGFKPVKIIPTGEATLPPSPACQMN